MRQRARYLYRKSKMNKRSVIGIVTMGLLLSALVVASRAYVLHRATTLMNEIRRIDQAPDPTAASMTFMRRHQSYLIGKTCDGDGCQHRFFWPIGFCQHSVSQGGPRSKFLLLSGTNGSPLLWSTSRRTHSRKIARWYMYRKISVKLVRGASTLR
jgi:hypothetical protein